MKAASSLHTKVLLVLTCVPLAVLAVSACGKGKSADPTVEPDTTNKPPDAGIVGSADSGSSNGSAVCDVVAQTGCTGDTPKCGLVGSKFGCQAGGTVAFGETCTIAAGSDDCQAGLVCAAVNSTTARCIKPCATGNASSCPTNYACSLSLSWNGGSANGGETFNICVSSSSQCSPELQNCSESTQGCFVTNSGNQCLMPGAVADGSNCVSANDCAKGSTCLNHGAGFKCFRLCSVAAPAPDAGSDAGTGGVDLPCPSGTCKMEKNQTWGTCG
jgi:hypothetical protein